MSVWQIVGLVMFVGPGAALMLWVIYTEIKCGAWKGWILGIGVSLLVIAYIGIGGALLSGVIP